VRIQDSANYYVISPNVFQKTDMLLLRVLGKLLRIFLIRSAVSNFT